MNTNPFSEILSPYFGWLNNLVGNLAKEARRHKLSPGTIAQDYLSDSRRRDLLISELPGYCSTIQSFWQSSRSNILHELTKLPGLKARFGGDLGPQGKDFIFERIGLYFDTIIVPDPLLRIAGMLEIKVAKRNEFLFLRYAIE